MSELPKDATPVPPRSKKGGGNSAAGRPPTRKSGASGTKPGSGRQARQAAQRRNRNLALTAVAAVVVIVIVVVIIAVSSSSSGTIRQAAPAAAVSKIENIPTSVLTAAVPLVGDKALQPATVAQGGPVSATSRPELLFIGAEFCPVCATERWPMVIALSKFGTFTNLQQTHSAVRDGNIGTWSFYGATYTSPYFTFTPVEAETNQPSGNNYKTLQTPNAKQISLWSGNLNGNESFPFIDFNGQAVLATAQLNPSTFEEKSFNDILDSVGSNNNTIGADTDAAAAVFTKHICNMISDKAPVCSAVASVPAPVVASSTGASSSAG